ncbi:MAG: BON domain-containing protein [Chloroflexi bacterium]|nr:BON domain-containing protein [Chloroflexota bacterium]
MAMSYGGFSGRGAFTTPIGGLQCPVCGYSGETWQFGPSPIAMNPYQGNLGLAGAWGLGGLRTWGETYSRQFTATGLPTDEEITEMVYDTIDADPWVPYDADINVEVEAGEVTLTGTVPSKRAKLAVGDDAWWIPGVVDVRNDLAVSGRHRVKPGREREETTG